MLLQSGPRRNCAPVGYISVVVKDGKLVYMLQRTDLQRMNEQQVSGALRKAFDEHCTRPGPSIDPEKFKQLRPHQGCGSQIPLMGERS